MKIVMEILMEIWILINAPYSPYCTVFLSFHSMTMESQGISLKPFRLRTTKTGPRVEATTILCPHPYYATREEGCTPGACAQTA